MNDTRNECTTSYCVWKVGKVGKYQLLSQTKVISNICLIEQ